MWMEEKRGTRINAERTRQALATGADVVATACPFCMTMMRDGVADAGASASVTVQDISEVLAAQLPLNGSVPSNGRSLPVVQ
jgi:Fe-S oxidoreductase